MRMVRWQAQALLRRLPRRRVVRLAKDPKLQKASRLQRAPALGAICGSRVSLRFELEGGLVVSGCVSVLGLSQVPLYFDQVLDHMSD